MNPEGSSILLRIFFLAGLIGINAFFAASEIAIITLNDKKVQREAEQGIKISKILHTLIAEPSKFLATIQVGATLSGLLASALAAESFSVYISRAIESTGLKLTEAVLKFVSVTVVTIVLSYFTLLFGELVPKRIAMQRAESISKFSAKPLSVLQKIALPFVKLLTLSTNLILRLGGVDPNANESGVTEEEIRLMVDLGEERGAIESSEKTMIENIFEFNNKTVTEIMTHRKDIVAIPIDARLEYIFKTLSKEQYTRLPVYEEDIDNIIGILHMKDLLLALRDHAMGELEMKNLIRQAYYIPTSKRIDLLFAEMKKHKTHMAIVIDEFGGTAGLVTVEDLLEEIVGSILDEYDDDEKFYEKLDENTFMIDGSTSLVLVRKILGIRLQTENYDTLSGFMIEHLGRIPAPGEHPVVETGGIVFKVEAVEEMRITKVKACRSLELPGASR